MESSPTQKKTRDPSRTIVRRLGGIPVHLGCDDALGWRRTIDVLDTGDFAIFLPRGVVFSEEQVAGILPDIQALGGGGGVAPYERMAAIPQSARRDFILSADYATERIGVIQGPDGSIQDPLFGLPGPDHQHWLGQHHTKTLVGPNIASASGDQDTSGASLPPTP